MQFRRLASQISNEAELVYILRKAKPELRYAVLSAIRPHLKFKLRSNYDTGTA
jgi:hypothetical protein